LFAFTIINIILEDKMIENKSNMFDASYPDLLKDIKAVLGYWQNDCITPGKIRLGEGYC